MKTKLYILLLSLLIVLNSKAQESPSYIVIRDAPDGGGTEVSTVTMTTDDSLTLYVASYDSSDNFIQNQVVHWYSTGSIDYVNTIDSSFVFSPIRAPTSGTIGAIVDNMSDATGTITVNVGELCYIKVRCSSNNSSSCFPEYKDTVTMYVGEILTLYFVGFDCDDNFRELVALSIDSTDIEYTGTLIVEDGIFTEPGQGRIIVAGIDTSGIIIVQEPSIVTPDYIQIRDAPDGEGSEFTTVTMTSDDSLTLYAASYDSSDKFIQNQLVEWSTTGNLDPVSVVDTVLVFRHTSSSAIGKIIATAGNISDTTGLIIVLRCGLCYVQIHGSLCPNVNTLHLADDECLPEYDDTTTVSVNDTLLLWAAGYDCSDNYMGGLVVKWDSLAIELTGTLSCEIPSGVGSSFTSTFTEPGQGRIIKNGTDTSGVIIVTENPVNVTTNKTIQTKFKLEQAYPNPFNPITTIKYYLPKPEYVVIEVFNSLGQKVETLVNRNMTAGEHKIEFNAENLSSGLYLYKITAGNFQDVKKFVLFK